MQATKIDCFNIKMKLLIQDNRQCVKETKREEDEMAGK